MWSFMLSFLLLVRLHLFIYVSQLFLACQNPGCQRLAARVAVCCPSNALLCLIFLAASKLATRKGWSYMLSSFCVSQVATSCSCCVRYPWPPASWPPGSSYLNSMIFAFLLFRAAATKNERACVTCNRCISFGQFPALFLLLNIGSI